MTFPHTKFAKFEESKYLDTYLKYGGWVGKWVAVINKFNVPEVNVQSNLRIFKLKISPKEIAG